MYKKIWFKIHLILGLTVGLVLLVIGTTGAILSFEKEILNVLNKDSYEVSVPNSPKLSTRQLLEIFQVKMPEAKINKISFSSDANSSLVINIAGFKNPREIKKGIDYYVNPYTAEILPNIKGKEFFKFIEHLHRWLALEGQGKEVGKQISAISTVALIVLLISGVIIYWPKIKRAFLKSLRFSFKHKGRNFISTMHSAVGMWVIPFYLLASLTGLYWSYDWYNTALYKIAGVEKPQKNKSKEKNENEEQLQSNFDSYQKAIELFNIFVQTEYKTATLNLTPKESTYKITYVDVNADHYRAVNNMHLDINKEELIKHERYEDKTLPAKLMQSMLPLHSGEYFGRIGQITMFIASLLMALFTITGFMLYIKRTKKKKKSSI